MRDHYDFSASKPNPYARRAKQQITIRLDSGTLSWFKAMAQEQGIPYQSLINLYLRDGAESGRKLEHRWSGAARPARVGGTHAKSEDETVTSDCMKEILAYLNAVHIRCTYKAVGEVIGVCPQWVRRYLGKKRPEASWVVNAKKGEPTGYTADEKHPLLKENKHIIRSGDELERCMGR